MATPTSLPATFVAGNVLTAAQMNDLRGAFRILQVVYGDTNTEVSVSTNTFTDTTLSVSITPTSSSSKVLVLVDQQGVYKSHLNAQNCVDLKLLRDSTDLLIFAQSVLWTNDTTRQVGSVSCSYLDSPATTSATTYKTQFRNPNNTADVKIQLQNVVLGAGNNPYSTIVAMEVSA